ncbi:class III lanthionine synthetase LanKC [Terriglobus sp. RCC_193]|uniref:class III lanthionine synthetase LanKC n=1 Tax=Terriglobus sp. RCC_193 TaxID=3239218 RepID=UPI003525E390
MGNVTFLRDIRHDNKITYTLTSPTFYEALEEKYRPSEIYTSLVAAKQREFDKAATLVRDGLWCHNALQEVQLPQSGWKVHVSASVWNDQRILGNVCDVLLPRDIPFKFALDRQVLTMMTHKLWARGGSGKFMTVYPQNVDECFEILEALYSVLRKEKGPFILSDRRYKDCRVLYYRFGGIWPTSRLEYTGLRTPVIPTPGGELVADIRQPYFSLPPWVDDPFAQEESDEAEDVLLNDRYRVIEALAFSNSGGVYLADDCQSSRTVIIKEARPYTLMYGTETDAPALLRREMELLEVLRPARIAPEPYDFFQSWENSFLVEEYLGGVDLRSIMLSRSPLLQVYPTRNSSSRYFDDYRTIAMSLIDALSSVHAAGIIFGDLSANNIKVNPSTFQVSLLDFDGAYRPGTDTPIELYTPGFRRSAPELMAAEMYDDLYSVAAIMLYLMFPIAAAASLREDLFSGCLSVMLRDIGWENTNLYPIISGLAANSMTLQEARILLEESSTPVSCPLSAQPAEFDIDEAIKGLGDFLLAHLNTNEASLFPADPFAYRTNSLGLGFGAAGVLYALTSCDVDIPSAGIDWLRDKCDTLSVSNIAPGLLTGAAGIAWCLATLGEHDAAIQLMEVANNSPMRSAHHSLLYGMAGIGMANLYMHQRYERDDYLRSAVAIADQLIDTAIIDREGVFWQNGSNIHVGLGYGQSGVALFLLRAYERTGESKYRSAGEKALAYDLAQAVERETGIVTFPRGTGEHTAVPYIEEGSAGIVKVAMRYGMWDISDRILKDVHRKYAVSSGLFFGLGSFVDALTDAYLLSKDRKYLEMARRPLCGLNDLYLIPRSGMRTVPGEGLFRVSCDYATGVAGVMRTLYRYKWFQPADFFSDPEVLVDMKRDV